MIPPHLYRLHGQQAGVEPSVLLRASNEHDRLLAQNAYPILTLGHLAHETGASYTYLREIVSRIRDPYRSIAKPKKSGGSRAISAPEPILMEVQRWLLERVLDTLPRHPASYAYEQGFSIVDCARKHQGAKWMLKMDLHDFFGTITESMVYKVFRRMGYSKLVAFELARIATRAQGAVNAYWRAMSVAIPSYSVTEQGVLPQGGPTSGKLANSVAFRLDNSLQAFALKNKLVYTRYSDDLFFSSYDGFRRIEARQIMGQVFGIIQRAGFTVHRSKTRIVPPGARKVILGLLVDDTVRLLPEHRRKIEVHLRGCENFGLVQHAEHRGFDSVFSFVEHINGWIEFAVGVERGRALNWRKRLAKILAKEGLEAF